VYVAASGSEEGAEKLSSRERGKEEPVILAGTKPRRDYTLSHTVRRTALFGPANSLHGRHGFSPPGLRPPLV